MNVLLEWFCNYIWFSDIKVRSTLYNVIGKTSKLFNNFHFIQQSRSGVSSTKLKVKTTLYSSNEQYCVQVLIQFHATARQTFSNTAVGSQSLHDEITFLYCVNKIIKKLGLLNVPVD